eukprot:scaffold48213_cov68-Phaeocystis_antarctica.AAC.1
MSLLSLRRPRAAFAALARASAPAFGARPSGALEASVDCEPSCAFVASSSRIPLSEPSPSRRSADPRLLYHPQPRQRHARGRPVRPPRPAPQALASTSASTGLGGTVPSRAPSKSRRPARL